MKAIFLFLYILFPGKKLDKEMNYTASTPAGNEVRDFLGISQVDSMDFIRWKLKIIDGKEFNLSCTYGIGKPNTNGFIDEKKVERKGTANLKNDVLTLSRQDKVLSLLILNDNIIHILNKQGTMMVGNGGWSYTLNSVKKVPTSQINFKWQETGFRDSVSFEGRTPCRGIEELMYGTTRPECYKKKWLVRLYRNGDTKSGTYKIGGTVPSKTGKWKLKENAGGKIIYSLDLNNGNTLDLLQTDENIVYIMDPKGGLMVGDHDFSYSLNRRIK